MHENRNRLYRISIWGTGNVAFRLSLALKNAGHTIAYICGRNEEDGKQLVHILNKSENTQKGISAKSKFTTDHSSMIDSDIVILAVSDDAIGKLSDKFAIFVQECLHHQDKDKGPVVLHTSGASSAELLSSNLRYGVLYPLMSLNKVKPVEFSMIPFLLEGSDKDVESILTDLVYSVGAEYRFCDSDERLRTHLAAVYVSNFVNYLAGLAFDLAKPNHIFLMPLAIETIRKAFLYDHPSTVQTGPAKRGDILTIEKHLRLLNEKPEHKEVYKFLTNLLLARSGYDKLKY